MAPPAPPQQPTAAAAVRRTLPSSTSQAQPSTLPSATSRPSAEIKAEIKGLGPEPPLPAEIKELGPLVQGWLADLRASLQEDVRSLHLELIRELEAQVG